MQAPISAFLLFSFFVYAIENDRGFVKCSPTLFVCWGVGCKSEQVADVTETPASLKSDSPVGAARHLRAFHHDLLSSVLLILLHKRYYPFRKMKRP